MSSNIHLLERLRNALNRGMAPAPAPAPVQEYDKRTSRELSEAVPQTDILGKITVVSGHKVEPFVGTWVGVKTVSIFRTEMTPVVLI